MIESHTIYSFFNFALFLLSCIIFVDILIQLKRPLILKIYFLVLVFSVGLYNFLFWLSFINIYILVAFPIIKFTIWVSMTLILSHLYVSLNKSWIYWILGFAALVLMYSNIKLYFYLKEINYSEKYFLQNAVDIFTQKVSSKINLIPRIVLITIFTTINLTLSYLIFKKSESDNHYYDKIRIWTMSFVLIEFFSVLVFVIMNSLLLSFDFGNILLSLIGLLILLIVLYRPRFLNKQSLKFVLSNDFKRDNEFSLTDNNFFTPFFINHYYLKEEATLEQYCIQNSISSTEHLQNQILKKYNMTFSNLVNKNRVEYFIELVKSPKYNLYTIDALAKASGFNSRHHLYKPFRKFHGGTPSDFISSVNS